MNVCLSVCLLAEHKLFSFFFFTMQTSVSTVIVQWNEQREKRAHWTPMFYQLDTVGSRVMQPGCRTHVLIGAWWKPPYSHPRIAHTGTHFCVFKVRLWNAAFSYGLLAGEVIKTRLCEGSVQNQCICFAFLTVAMWDATEFNSYI